MMNDEKLNSFVAKQYCHFWRSWFGTELYELASLKVCMVCMSLTSIKKQRKKTVDVPRHTCARLHYP